MSKAWDISAFILQFICLLIIIYFGARKGGIGVGLLGAFGVLVFTLGWQLDLGSIPWDVIMIIMGVICAISAAEVAGGMDLLIDVAARLLRRKPDWITFVAPVVAFALTVCCGTGNSSFALYPIVIEVAKKAGVRPSKPLVATVVAAQLGITASPISAAMVALSDVMEPLKVSYPLCLAIQIPASFLGVFAIAAVSHFQGCRLEKDRVFRERMLDGSCRMPQPQRFLTPEETEEYWRKRAEVTGISAEELKRQDQRNAMVFEKSKSMRGSGSVEGAVTAGDLAALEEGAADVGRIPSDPELLDLEDTASLRNEVSELVNREATMNGFEPKPKPTVSLTASEVKRQHRRALWAIIVFLVTVLIVVVYACITSSSLGIIPEKKVRLPKNESIACFMLTAALVVSLVCNLKPIDIVKTSTFRTGMTACVCVFGVGLMGNTFVSGHLSQISSVSQDILKSQEWVFAFILIISGMLLYSQAVTTRTMYPIAVEVNMSKVGMMGAYPAVLGLFILPTYPTTLASIELDDTGSTRTGKFVVDHPFILPSLAGVAVSCLAAFGISALALR